MICKRLTYPEEHRKMLRPNEMPALEVVALNDFFV